MGLSIDTGVSADADAGDDGIFLKLLGKLNIGLESLVSQGKKAEAREQARLERLPTYATIDRVTDPFTGTAIVTFDGPMPGRQWHIRKLSALAIPLASNVAVVTWYVGQVVPTGVAGTLPPTMAEWQFASVPAFQTFGKLELVMLPGEKLIAGVTGAPAATQLGLNMAYNDYPFPGYVE